MSISPSLQASARAAYRSLFRAASVTFSGEHLVVIHLHGSRHVSKRIGDDRVLNAFLDKTRKAYREGRSLTDESQYEENVRLAHDVAVILRTNVVQGQKGAERDVWELKIHRHSELGDNNTIKSPSQSRGNVKTDQVPPKASSPLTPKAQVPQLQKVNFSALKRLRQGRNLPQLDECDLEESFVRGSGPGGQSVNKTENCVQILHRSSGLRVSCQQTRSLAQNRQIARKLLIDKLDHMLNPGLSKGDMRRARMQERERQKRKKRRKKEKLEQLGTDMDIDA